MGAEIRDPSLSVVVPTYRRPALLRRCLASLANQVASRECFEVIVADDGSSDRRTDRVLERAGRALPNLRWVTLTANAGPASARNQAVAQARGELLLFLDDDVVASPGLVEEHLRFHHDAGDPMVGMLGVVRWEPRLRVTSFMRWLDRSGLQFGYDTWLQEGPVDPPFAAFYTANLSMRRELFRESGGFDERFPYANYEDIELAWRLSQLGFRLHYVPEAVAYHARAIALRAFCRRMANEAESAKLLRLIQPDFPLDETDRQAGRQGPRRRLLLRLLAPAATVGRRHALLEAHYRAEIAAAYGAGASRPAAHAGRRRETDRVATGPGLESPGLVTEERSRSAR